MKWHNSLFKYALIPVLVLVLSLFIIYCFRQNFNVNANTQKNIASIPEIRNGQVNYWDIRTKKELESFRELRDELISHYHLDNDYYANTKYVDYIIYQNKFMIIDKKYRNKGYNNKDYDVYAITMEGWGESNFYKVTDPNIITPYKNLIKGGVKNEKHDSI